MERRCTPPPTHHPEMKLLAGHSLAGFPFRLSSEPGRAALPLQIWDTGGQERFRSMVSTFYKGSDGCVLAFDVTDPESFEALGIWRDDVLAKINPVEQSYPMVVLGNKIDLEDRKVLCVCSFIQQTECNDYAPDLCYVSYGATESSLQGFHSLIVAVTVQ